MHFQELESKLRSISLRPPESSWKREILSHCDDVLTTSPGQGRSWYVKALVLSGVGALVYAAVFESFDSESDKASNRKSEILDADVAPQLSLTRQRPSGISWDAMLLQESDEILDFHSVSRDDLANNLAQYRDVLVRFEEGFKDSRLYKVESLPLTRIGKTAEALCMRALHRLDLEDTEGAFRDCLTLTHFAKMLERVSSFEAAIRKVGVVGLLSFPCGIGMLEDKWDDEQLEIIQSQLLRLRPLATYMNAITVRLHDTDPIVQEMVQAWDEHLNGFRRNVYLLLEGIELPKEATGMLDSCEVDLRLRHVIMAVALERFRRQFGEVPESLEELVPDVMPSPITNPWTGRPFEYEKLAPDNASIIGRPGQVLKMRHE